MRRNVRKINKDIGKNVVNCVDTPFPLEPLPMTYEPQAASSRKSVPSKYDKDKSQKNTDKPVKVKKTKKVVNDNKKSVEEDNHVRVPSSLLGYPSREEITGTNPSNDEPTSMNFADLDANNNNNNDVAQKGEKNKKSIQKKSTARKSANFIGILNKLMIIKYN